MLIVAIGWIYVVGLAAIAEALSPQGTVLGAFFTFVLYGVLPLTVVLYLMATPARKKVLRRAELQELQELRERSVASAADPDGGGHAAAGAARAGSAGGTGTAVAPEREEP